MDKDLKQYLDFVETSVTELKFPAKPESLYQPMTYILSLGGKRIRPVLTLLSTSIFSGEYTRAKHASLAVELFHNFSLIHDDIMDKAPMRRGKETVHTKWNTDIAILSGDAMLIEAYKQLQHYNPEISYKLIQLFNQTSIEVCEGQQMDMDFETLQKVSIDDYIQMIKLKTAVLLGCSLKMGAIVANTGESNQSDIYNFGVNLGIAFQLQDDILDLYADQNNFGKLVGGDILANKKTYLILRAMEDSNELQLASLHKMIQSQIASEKIDLALSLFDQLKIKEKAENKMNDFYQMAINNIQHLEITEDKKSLLLQLAEYLMARGK